MKKYRVNLFRIFGLLCVCVLISSCISKKPIEPDRTGNTEPLVLCVRKVYGAAENVYIGKLLSAERNDDYVPSDSLPTLNIKVEVQKVFKGEFKAQESIDDIFIGDYFLYEPDRKDGHQGILKAGETYLFMTGEDSSFNSSNTAHYVMTNNFYKAIHLLDNGQIDLYLLNLYPEGFHGFEFAIEPPKNYHELLVQLATPLPDSFPWGSPSYECPCEYPDELVKNWLLFDDLDPHDLYCEIHGVDNTKRVESK